MGAEKAIYGLAPTNVLANALLAERLLWNVWYGQRICVTGSIVFVRCWSATEVAMSPTKQWMAKVILRLDLAKRMSTP